MNEAMLSGVSPELFIGVVLLALLSSAGMLFTSWRRWGAAAKVKEAGDATRKLDEDVAGVRARVDMLDDMRRDALELTTKPVPGIPDGGGEADSGDEEAD